MKTTRPKLLTPSIQKPLYGKRIIVTAPRNYGARLCQQLIERGALPLLMPTIETCVLENFAQLDATLQNLALFDWIAFTSRNGIDAFCQRWQDIGFPLATLNNFRLAAIGKDGERLDALGIKVDLLPTEPSPTGIVAELAQIPHICQQSILLPIPEVVGIPEPDVIPNFVTGLKNLGMKVTCIPTYRTQSIHRSLYEVELNLIRQGSIDAIAFSSTAEIASFLQMVATPRDYQQCTIACFGPYTAANARKLGLDVSIVAQDYSSFAGFTDAIAQALGSEGVGVGFPRPE